MNDQPIAIELIAEPTQLTMAERSAFTIGMAATNRGNEVVDPQLYLATLSINGANSLSWSTAVGNGHREANWFALPPGDTVSMRWGSMGERLFPAPGEYTLELRLGDQETPPIVVRVFP